MYWTLNLANFCQRTVLNAVFVDLVHMKNLIGAEICIFKILVLHKPDKCIYRVGGKVFATDHKNLLVRKMRIWSLFYDSKLL
jgi:hypothetical protein